MTLSENRVLRLITLCLLYVAQGIPWGFATVTLKAYLSGQDMGVEQIGQLVAMVTIPWSFKWAWGPIIDSFVWPTLGRRRPWILIAQTFMTVTIASLLLIEDPAARLATVGWLLLIHNVFVSLQDVSVDALAVDLLDDSERGRANGLMYGSSFFGTFIGGAVLGRVAASSGLRTALLTWLAINVLIMLVPALCRERPGQRLIPWFDAGVREWTVPRGQRGTILLSLQFLLRAFRLRSTVLGAVLAILIKIGSGILSAVAVVTFMQLGWTQQEFTDIEGGWATAAGLLASFSGGWLADRFGARRVIAAGSMLLGIVWLTFGGLESYWIDKRLVTALLLTQETLLSVISVGLFALFMKVSWPMVAATQFTAYMSLMNLSTTIGAGIAGRLDAVLSTASIYVVAGLLQLIVPLLLAFIDADEARRVLGGIEETAGDSGRMPLETGH